MDTKLQTSFIPKKPIVTMGGIQRERHFNFLSLIIFMIFMVAAVGAVGVFSYEKYLNAEIANMTAKLKAAQDSLDPSLISGWVRLDKRIESGKEILNLHLALSSFFDLLQKMTLKTVQFKNFNYTIGNGQKISISMNGQADSFAAVALQSDEFAKSSKYITNQLFSNVNIDKETGQVVFQFTATLDPSIISYAKSITSDSSVETTPLDTTTDTETKSTATTSNTLIP